MKKVPRDCKQLTLSQCNIAAGVSERAAVRRLACLNRVFFHSVDQLPSDNKPLCLLDIAAPAAKLRPLRREAAPTRPPPFSTAPTWPPPFSKCGKWGRCPKDGGGRVQFLVTILHFRCTDSEDINHLFQEQDANMLLHRLRVPSAWRLPVLGGA